ncbi:sensor histidine kinase [Ekhidna sp.]
MSSSLKNTVLILTLAVLLPVAIFSAVEVASLNENEQMLEQVYREQLDGIIFSVNQYAADLFDFYIQQIDYQYQQEGFSSLSDPGAIKGNLAIEFIALSTPAIQTIDFNEQTELGSFNIDSAFSANELLIERLIRYKETDYIKQEVIGEIRNTNENIQISLIIIGKDTPCLVFIDPVAYIEDLLAPKIQQITTQAINTNVRDTITNRIVYQSKVEPTGIIQSGPLNKTPGYEINVSLYAQSVTDLISYRTKRNLITLSIVVFIILAGMVLIIRNLRKEIQLNKTKADFVANVSHEIRTPLALISMFNETLLMGRVKEDKKYEYYEIISKETSRLKNIVNKILSFSQIDANKKAYNFSKVSPDEIIKDVVNSYSYHLSEKGFTYDLNLNGNIEINADHEAFSEVLINLIDNAMKYSKEEKHIVLESKSDQTHYILDVSDKGVGIDKKNQKNIFDKFFRVEGGNVHNTKGTGLGLSLVAEIMKAHNAEISVESTLGEGSQFTLKFPII